MRTLSKYFTGENDEKQLFDGTTTSYFIKPQQVFVSSFVGHKASVPSLTEFEIIDVDPGAFSDGQGNLVIPPQSGIEYVSAIGIDLGTITGEYEISDDSGFTSIVASGSLHPTNPTSVPVGLVGPFYVRYRLDSSIGIFSTWFEDTRSPFMSPEPLVGAGAVAPPYTASESSALNNLGVELIFDNLGTVASHTSLVNPPHWYRVDFQDLYVVTSYKLWGFNNAVTPSLPVNYELQGSNDGGTTWVSVDTQVNNPPPNTVGYNWVSGGESIPHLTLTVADPASFLSYRFYCTVTSNDQRVLRIRELQLIGYDPFPLAVPIIGAGAVAPPYTATESSAFNDNPVYGVQIIFDNLGTDSSHTKAVAPPHWYRVDFQDPYVVTSYKIWGHFNAQFPDFPVDYELQGSNDGGATWFAVDTQINNPPPSTSAYPAGAWVSGGETVPHITLPVANPGAFFAYRFNCTAVTPRNILRIRELKLIGFAP